MQNDENILFVGIKINDNLRDELDDSKPSMKPFFNDNNLDFLQILRIDSDEYIGKKVESGISMESLNDIHLNVKTMLKMIAPRFSLAENALKIYAHTPLPERIYY